MNLGTQSSRWLKHHLSVIKMLCSGCSKDSLWHWGWPHSFQEEGSPNPPPHLRPFPQGKIFSRISLRNSMPSVTGLAQDGRQCVFLGLQADQWPEQDLAGVCGRIPAFATVGQFIYTFFSLSRRKRKGAKNRGTSKKNRRGNKTRRNRTKSRQRMRPRNRNKAQKQGNLACGQNCSLHGPFHILGGCEGWMRGRGSCKFLTKCYE